MNCSAVMSRLAMGGVYGWFHRSATLFEPFLAQQVVIDGEQGAVVEEQVVVLAGDGVFAPPLVVDAPVVLNAGDGARGEPALAPDGDDAALSIGVHAQWGGRVEWSEVVAAQSHRE